MKSDEIARSLSSNYNQFIESIESMNESTFTFRPSEEKWTNAQNLEHLILSVAPVGKAMGLPKFVLRTTIGVSNRPSRSYDDLVKRYWGKLEAGGVSTKKFEPTPISFSDKSKLSDKLKKEVNKLIKTMGKFSEDELETLILPHPLLGKLTLREMLMFTAYHGEHHFKIVSKNIELQQLAG